MIRDDKMIILRENNEKISAFASIDENGLRGELDNNNNINNNNNNNDSTLYV